MFQISRCSLSAKGVCVFGCWRLQAFLYYVFLSKVFEKIAAGKLSQFLKSNSMVPSSQFWYRRGLGICACLLTLFHSMRVALDRSMEGRLVQLNFSATFDRVSRCGQLYQLRSIGAGWQFLSTVTEFLCDRRQRVRLDVKVGASVDVVSRVPQGSILRPLLFILYTSEIFHIVVNHIVGQQAEKTIFYPQTVS